MKKILVLAALVYTILAPLTYHPDTKLTLYYASLNQGRVWDIYTYLHNNPDNFPKFHYPPMHYWLLKGELPLVNLIGGKGIVDWLKIGSNVAFEEKNIFLYNLATKMPILLLVILSGWLIGKILLKNGYKPRTASLAMIIWLFNPITIYSAVMMGQNDILAICPFLIGLYFYYDNPFLAFLMFGWGGSVKSYPLIWAIGLAMVYPRANWYKKIGLILIPIGFYLLTLAPFIRFDYFKQDVLYSGLSERMFEAAMEIGFGDKILMVPLLLVILTIAGIRRKLGRNLKMIGMYLATMSLVILGFSHFHPQWFMWIMPFLAIYLATDGEWTSWIFLLPALLGIILLFGDVFLYWGIVASMNPEIINLPFLNDLLASRGVPVGMLNSLAHSVVAGISLYWLNRCINED